MFLFFEDLNTLEHGLSVCTGNNSWYYIGVSRKSEGGGAGVQKIDLISILPNIFS